jgi:hypothetical protein
MKTLIRTSLVLALWATAGSVALAETIVVNDQVAVRESNVARPTRGMTMQAVEAKFGAATQKHGAVGIPPISRWDYGDFAVFFEKDRVIHAVALR